MTVFIIVINGFVFAQELLGGEAFVLRWAAVPANIVGGQVQQKFGDTFNTQSDRQFWPRLLLMLVDAVEVQLHLGEGYRYMK